MPGICGIAASSPLNGDIARVLESMQQRLVLAPWHAAAGRVVEPSRCALGTAALDHHRHARFYADANSGDAIAFDGELYEVKAANESGQHASIDKEDHARVLLHGYLRRGISFVDQVNGSFAAAIWLAQSQRLILLTDRFATRPVYYRHDRSTLRFASTIASLLGGDGNVPRVNPRGLAQFFTFGHYLRDDTSLEGVRVLPSAACFEYDADSNKLTPKTYWSLKRAPGELPESDAAIAEEIDASFAASVQRQTAETPNLGISLSGGLDARAILGLIDTTQSPLTAVCMGVRGSLDHRSSAELARIAGCPFHEFLLDGAFLQQFRPHMERMVELTDGQYLSQCIVIPTLDFYRQLGIRSLLRGHGGELMHMRKAYSYSLDDEALAIRSDDQLKNWLSRRLQAYMLDGVTKPLFRPEFQSGLKPLASQSLAEDLADVADVEDPLTRIWHLFVQQRLRRETVISMLKFRSYVEPRLPYFDEDLVAKLLAAPTRLKLGEELHTHILRKRRPAYLNVLNANTGAPLGCAPWRQRLSTFQLKVFSKLGLPGYQPYERLGLWLRQELAPLVREMLLAEETLDNGVYDPDGIHTVVRGHLEEGKNHTYLLIALMIFELGRRRLASTIRQPASFSLPDSRAAVASIS